MITKLTRRHLGAAALVLLAGCETITGRKAAASDSASNPALSALSVSNGTLTPKFNADSTSYSLAVTNDITTMTVTPVSGSSDATVTVNGGPVTSGSPSPNIALAVGTNTILIRVLAADGTTSRNYTIAATRAP
jgi:hypothetical protein